MVSPLGVVLPQTCRFFKNRNPHKNTNQIAAIESLDYEVIPRKKATGPNVTNITCMRVIVVSLYVMLQSMGILNLLVSSRLADTKMEYGMLFVIGLINSVHCIAMCGGINLSQCISHTAQGEAEDTEKLAVFHPMLAYNMGWVLSYTAVGFVLGLIVFLIGGGSEAETSIFLQGILKIIAGLFMEIMGINMLGFFHWLRKFTIRMPRFLVPINGTNMRIRVKERDSFACSNEPCENACISIWRMPRQRAACCEYVMVDQLCTGGSA